MTEGQERTEGATTTRRTVISGVVAGAAVIATAGLGVLNAVRYLIPRGVRRERETFLGFTSQVPEGGTLEVTLPDKRRIQVTRLGDEFVGFSTVCPHLACRVRWEKPADGETDPHKKSGYFRCPCHEGLFAPDGNAFSGPPADAKQSLERVPLVDKDGVLYARWQEEIL